MRICIALLICFFSLALYASQKAVTDEGEIVILNDDGTWIYEDLDQAASSAITTNPQEFQKSPELSFDLKSTRNDSKISLDTAKWSFKKAAAGDDVEYEFQLKGEDLYGILITEQVEIALESFTKIAFATAQAFAPNMRIVNREYRVVNGLKVIYMEMQGEAEGIDFTYRGYYFSNKSGSTQLITYTGTNVVDKYDNEIQEFLNGLSVQ